MTHHLHLTGLVQGVGFRPFVWQLAQTMHLTGTVSNGTDGVHIYLNADEPTAHHFRSRVLAEAPVLSSIQSAELHEVDAQLFTDFSIVESEAVGLPNLLLTPDVALCDTCRAELFDRANRRYGYAFTNCTHCGPRYSIQESLPYDRPTTTMAPFVLCETCQTEYHNPVDRRFFAQTNSCPNCPVELSLYVVNEGKPVLIDKEPIAAVMMAIQAGKIVAVKGVGGYLLLCDATNAGAIQTLRERKNRPAKPLAVLYPSRAILEQDCHLAPDEWALLNSPAAPIVLLRQRSKSVTGLAADQLSPGLSQLGVMLPYAPLLALITEAIGKPLVATSGNASGSPICYTDEQALTYLTPIADLLLTHNRAIVMPQDDSVMRLTERTRQPIVIRRARGLAPTFMAASVDNAETNVLALGASLKSTFAWQLRGNTYLSQYLGDLESFDTQQQFRRVLDHFRILLAAKPDVLLADAHEGYFSTQLARQFGADWNVPVVLVQHHEAHLAAVLAEHDRLDNPEPVLGIIWDGTGYGTDGHIWGGEFIRYQPDAEQPFERVAHFREFDALLGDKMPREPRLSALSLTHDLPEAISFLRPKFSGPEWTLYPKLLIQNRLKTTSVGRLFDAVASLLGLSDRVSYEGEAALLLEEAATRYVTNHGFASVGTYLPKNGFSGNVPTRAIVAGVVADRLANVPAEQIAATFHHTLVQVVQIMAHQFQSQTLAFSGGVFQNALLIDWLRHELEPTHTLLFHRQLSPNDECIALGQLAHYRCTQTVSQITDNHVFSYSR